MLEQRKKLIKYLTALVLLLSLVFLDVFIGVENAGVIVFFQSVFVLFLLVSFVSFLKVSTRDWLNPSVFFIGFLCLMFVFNSFNYSLWGFFGRNETGDFKLVGWINIVGLMGVFLFFIGRVMGRKDCFKSERYPQLMVSNQTVFLLMILAALSLAGGYQVYKGFSHISLYFTNPDLVRAMYGESATGLGWLLLKQTYNLAGISITILFLSRPGSISVKVVLSLFVVFSFFMFSLYGGRWLPLSLGLFLLVLTNRFYRPVSIKNIFTFFVIIFVLSTSYAAYRYTSDLEQQMSVDDVAASYFRQGSGANAELALVLNSTNYGDRELSKLFFQDIAEAALPTPLYVLVFGHGKNTNISLAGYFVLLEDRNGARGLRVTMFGEIYLVFGFVGVLLVGMLVGAVFRWLDSLYVSGDVNKVYISLILSIQFLSVHLLGFTKIVGVLQFLVLTVILFLLIRWQKKL